MRHFLLLVILIPMSRNDLKNTGFCEESVAFAARLVYVETTVVRLARPPELAGVAHVPSPRQNVDEDAPVPLLKSATTRLRKVGPAGPPEIGPANMRFADCVFSVKLKAGVVVGLLTDVVNRGLSVPALNVVTVPVPEGGVAHVPSPRQKVEDEAPVPLLKSATTSDRKVGPAGPPDVGPAKMRLAFCVLRVKLSAGVDDGVATEVVNNGLSAPALNEVTVPLPPPPVVANGPLR
jgi:hypothetical protein